MRKVRENFCRTVQANELQIIPAFLSKALPSKEYKTTRYPGSQGQSLMDLNRVSNNALISDVLHSVKQILQCKVQSEHILMSPLQLMSAARSLLRAKCSSPNKYSAFSFQIQNWKDAQGRRTKMHTSNYPSISNLNPMAQKQDGIPKCRSSLK